MKRGSLKPLPETLRTAFERFWSAYPKRSPNPRRAAEVAFAKAVAAGAEPAALIAAASAYAEECRRQKIDPIYVPHARTWLHQERFADYAAAAEAALAPAAPAPTHPLAAELLAAGLTAEDIASWFHGVEIEVREGVAIVTVPSLFRGQQLRTRYEDAIRRAVGASGVTFRVPGGQHR